MLIKMEKIQKLASEITDSVNSFSFDQKVFNQAISSEHRTLQQSFSRMYLGWLEYVASEEYRTNVHNDTSKTLAIKIFSLLEKDREK